MSTPRQQSVITTILFLLVCATALLARWPLITYNDTFFRDEDDAQQFNRVVEMAQTGDLNPHYFNKPSLNFYLRQPIVASAAELLHRRGELKSIRDVRTRDPFGPQGYAFTASHPTLVRWNRVFSVALSVGVVAFAFSIAIQLGRGPFYASFAGLITAFSPEVFKNSHIIGVDVLMAFLCLACTSVGIRSVERPTRANLILTGLLAGLAGAAKYNALPIVLIPLTVWALKERTRYGLFLALTSPGVGFLMGCPYALLSFNEFASAVAYEAWHYSIAGHDGHSAEPGLEQAKFYFGWLIVEGVGVAAGGLALASSVYFIKRRNFAIAVFLAFPIAYSALMIAQKTNFTRNMVVMVPYVAIMAACGLARLSKVAEHESVKVGAPPALASLALIQLTIPCYAFILAQRRLDSRELAAAWIAHERPSNHDVAISGELQMPPRVFKANGVISYASNEETPASLLQQGYDYSITSPLQTSRADLPLLLLERHIPGALYEQRIPDSPSLHIYKLNTERIAQAARRAPSSLVLATIDDSDTPTCADEGDTYCWLVARQTTVRLANTAPEIRKATIDVMTPWPEQTLTISTVQGMELFRGAIPHGPQWTPVTFYLPSDIDTLIFVIAEVHAPPQPEDNAGRIGVALRPPQMSPLSAEERAARERGVLAGYPEPIRVALLDTVTQEIEAPPTPIPTDTNNGDTAQQSQTGTLYTILDTMAPSDPSPSDVVTVPTATDPELVAKQQAEMREKFVDSILAVTAEIGE